MQGAPPILSGSMVILSSGGLRIMPSLSPLPILIDRLARQIHHCAGGETARANHAERITFCGVDRVARGGVMYGFQAALDDIDIVKRVGVTRLDAEYLAVLIHGGGPREVANGRNT